MNHLDDDAELYALGLTDRERDAEIEAHLATCADCRTRVAAAEEAAAALAATLPPMPAAAPARRAWWPALASAAAVAFAATTAFEGISAHTASSQLQRTDVALTAIASSHFGHTTLTSDPGVVAKALYSRDGAWCYVVASGVPRGAHLVMHRGSASRDLGALEPGAPATLFVHGAGRADEIAVVAGDHVVAHGVPAY
jgi:Putative zinc-finger